MDVDRALCDQMRAQAGTEQMVRINTSVLRGFLHWGHQHGYFGALQAELLPRACSRPTPSIRRARSLVEGQAPREELARQTGQSERYVGDEDAPSRALVTSLRRALAEHFPRWGALAPELAANSGPRWGEQFQLTAHDVHLNGCGAFGPAHVHVDWQVDGSGSDDHPRGRRVRPKNTTRVVPVAAMSFTGYPLRARVAAALLEQSAGTNPEGLLFPAHEGGMLWYSSFNADHLLPAMEAAGWPVEHWREEYDRWDPESGRYVPCSSLRRNAVLPWHSLGHRFARICVDDMRMPEGELMAVGGWENIATVQNRYYKSGKDNMERGLGYFD
jgi:hypothetical protein